MDQDSLPQLRDGALPQLLDGTLEAAVLDRQFRLLREDMLGPLRQELQEERKVNPGQQRRVFPYPRVRDVGFKPYPHVQISVGLPPRLAGRVLGIKSAKERAEFFRDGPGRRVLGQDTLVLLMRGDKCLAVGTVVARDNMYQEQTDTMGKKQLELVIGVYFPGDNLAQVLPWLTEASNSKRGARMDGVVGPLTARSVMEPWKDDDLLGLDDRIDEALTKVDEHWLEALKFVTQHLLCLTAAVAAQTTWRPVHHPSSLEDALVCLAAAVTEKKNGYPMQARRLALQFERAITVNALWAPKCMLDLAKTCETLPATQPAAQSASRPDAKERWEECKRQWKKARVVPPPVMDKVMSMIGLEEVKASLIDQFERVQLAKVKKETGASSYNTRFEGNPGSGKTTVARHYAQLLQELEVLPKGSVFEDTTASKLIHGGVAALEELLGRVEKAKGGVVFIDEAYQLVNDAKGKQLLDHILPLAESLYAAGHPVVWILAGYKADMEKMFEHNPGLPSRFPQRYHFADYTDEELLAIFNRLLTHDPNPAPPAQPPARTTAANGSARPSQNRYGQMGFGGARPTLSGTGPARIGGATRGNQSLLDRRTILAGTIAPEDMCPPGKTSLATCAGTARKPWARPKTRWSRPTDNNGRLTSARSGGRPTRASASSTILAARPLRRRLRASAHSHTRATNMMRLWPCDAWGAGVARPGLAMLEMCACSLTGCWTASRRGCFAKEAATYSRSNVWTCSGRHHHSIG